VIARVTVAVLRTVAIARHELTTVSNAEPPEPHVLLAEAFQVVGKLNSAANPNRAPPAS
jgi:hypothetical protein